ncbi:cytosine deaminase [Roseobacter denitrificans]|nr:amidohydrolase family protein [Roseobacter denitrificans]AVL54029.1 cytosine deaminase [Roseobacter denitrificans]
MTVLRDILVPLSLLRDPATFGGRTEGDCLRGDLTVKGGRAMGLTPVAPSQTPRILMPALVEAHCHLDKCHSIDRMKGIGGDLSAAIAAQTTDKQHWTADDLRHRMTRGLRELAAAGCALTRSHIDWGTEPAPPLAWSVLQEAATGFPDMTVQMAALTSISQLADREFCFAVASHIARHRAGVLGAFVLHHDQSDVNDGLAHVFAAADRFGLALDFHVDEGLGPYNGLEAICDAALASRFEGPILCGHAVSLIEHDTKTRDRIIDKLLRANISVCALPTTNLYLQGRRYGTPRQRGLTCLRELDAAGVPIVIASDNVADAFCPVGQHDPRAALHLACLAAHLDPPMGDWLPAITLNAARALGQDPVHMDTTPISQLRLCTAASTAELLATRNPLLPLHHFEKASTP